MPKIYTYLLSLSLCFSLQAQDYIWESSQFIQPNYGFSVISRMDVSPSGEKVVLGYFEGSISIEDQSISTSKPIGVFLAKFDINGDILWLKKVAEGEEYSLETFLPVFSNTPLIKISLEDDIYVGLTFRDSILIEDIYLISNDSVPNYNGNIVLKYNQHGELSYYTNSEGYCFRVFGFDTMTFDEYSNLYTLSSYGNDVWGTTDSCQSIIGLDTLTTQSMGSFLVKINSNGHIIWLQTLETSNVSNIEIINKNIYLSGTSFGAQDISFTGYTLEYPTNYDYGAYIAKFDTSGTFHWAKYFGVNGWDSHIQIYDVHAVSDNDILVLGNSFTQSVANRIYLQDAPTLIGTSTGGQDAFVVCYDSLGNVKWSDIIVNYSNDWFFNAVSDADKNIFIGGTFTGSTLELEQDTLISQGSHEVFITAYDSLGNHLWAKSAGGSGLDQTKGLKMDSQQNLYLLGGTASQPVHFGENTYNLTGSTAQIFMAKLAPYDVGVLEQELNAAIRLYPNPNTGEFSLQSEQALTTVEIYNLLGEKVYTKALAKNTKQTKLAAKLKGGIYFVILHTEANEQWVQKIIID